jgi:hypothetical protein
MASSVALAGRGLRFPFLLLPKGQLPQLPRPPPRMLAGSGRPIEMAEPLLDRGRMLVALDRPLMGGQLPALRPQRPLPRGPHPPLGLFYPDHRLVAVTSTLHNRPAVVSKPANSTHPMMATEATAWQA